MSEEDFLVQDEIDALLNSVNGAADEAKPSDAKARIKPYDPRNQHRIIKERLHALDMINQRFARLFRIALFNLIRRSADISVEPISFESYDKYSRNVPVPTNINLVTMKPLRGTALFVFPPAMVYMVVDSLFGGDGRFLARSEGREFTATEQRIIQRLLQLATKSYEEAWASIFQLDIEYLRAESQAKFTSITNSPNDVIVYTTYHLEVGSSSMDFQICIPYAMIEPVKDLLSNPVDRGQEKEDGSWRTRFSNELRQTEVEIVADFVPISTRINNVLSLKIGDIMPIELPEAITCHVDGIPVLECAYGSSNGHRALSVKTILEIPGDPPSKKAETASTRATMEYASNE
jgi:flagellar motor switch protein FliM